MGNLATTTFSAAISTRQSMPRPKSIEPVVLSSFSNRNRLSQAMETMLNDKMEPKPTSMVSSTTVSEFPMVNTR